MTTIETPDIERLRELLAERDDAWHISIPGDPSFSMFEDRRNQAQTRLAKWLWDNAGSIAKALSQIEAMKERVAGAESALKTCADVIETFRDPDLLSEGVHAGLRKGTDAPDSHALWAAIAGSKTSAWSDAIAFALDPYFTMWGGDEALRKAASWLQDQAGGEGHG